MTERPFKKLLMQKTSVFSSGQDGATLEGADGPVSGQRQPLDPVWFGGGDRRENPNTTADRDEPR